MTPTFNVCKSNVCGIIITGLTKGAGGYLPEDSSESVVGQFKYSETVTVDVVQLSKTDDTELIKSVVIPHTTEDDETTVTLNKDGLFSISHIIIPTTEWLQKENQKPDNTLSSYATIYVSDGSSIYKYTDGQLVECPALELAERNPDGTTISISEKSTFSICYLSKCFVTLCNEILNMNLSKCRSKNTDLEDLTFKRDFVWMTINVIKYLVSLGQLVEAQRILEETDTCNGICNSINIENKTLTGRSGCGCN
jgi:hypothetical protein|nr:MAG TPA: hypothetical protein [Caudoviricetes sp.]